MPTQTLHFSRPMTPAFFEGASHDDLKWTINYLISLLEKPVSKEHVVYETAGRSEKSDMASAHDFYGIWKDETYDCQDMIDDIKRSRSFRKEIIEI